MRDATGEPDQVFVVRAWQDHLNDDPNSSDWRGRVSHLNSKSVSYFVGMAALRRICQQILSQTANRSANLRLEETEDQS